MENYFWMPKPLGLELSGMVASQSVSNQSTSWLHLIMAQYIKSWDTLFMFHPQLWLRSNGLIPLCSWFIKHLHHYFTPQIAGQSLQAGGATAMAEVGAEPQLIKGAGQWSSSAFERYIRKNPVILHVLILPRSSHYNVWWPQPHMNPSYKKFLSIIIFPYTHAFRLDFLPTYLNLSSSLPTYSNLANSSPPFNWTITKKKKKKPTPFYHFSRSVQIFIELPRLSGRGAAYRLTPFSALSYRWVRKWWLIEFRFIYSNKSNLCELLTQGHLLLRRC